MSFFPLVWLKSDIHISEKQDYNVVLRQYHSVGVYFRGKPNLHSNHFRKPWNALNLEHWQPGSVDFIVHSV